MPLRPTPPAAQFTPAPPPDRYVLIWTGTEPPLSTMLPEATIAVTHRATAEALASTGAYAEIEPGDHDPLPTPTIDAVADRLAGRISASRSARPEQE